MDDHELEALLADLESDRVERKPGLADRAKIRQAICAFANDLPNHAAPGVVFVGVNDDGSPAEQPITDEMLRGLAHMRDDGQLLPFPTMTVQKKRIGGFELAVVEVAPSDMPPIRLNGRVWIRVGPRRAQATAEDERRLIEKRRWGNLTFDQQPAAPATFDDLDMELFRREYLPSAVPADILRANKRPVEDQVAALRFIAPDRTPNHAAILVFGKDPLRFLPGAYVQFVRFDGSRLTDPVRAQKELSGPLSLLLRQLDDLLSVNISVAADITSATQEIRMPDYPVVALRQLVQNAIMHRTYESTNAPTRIYWFSDRIEISSPGGPYGQVTVQNFGQPGVTDYRNPLVAEAMRTLGYVQRFGLGIQLARSALRENGNPELEFDLQPTVVLAIVRGRS